MANKKPFTANNYNILFEARRISSGFKFINDLFLSAEPAGFSLLWSKLSG